jgi:hypothetical protein
MFQVHDVADIKHIFGYTWQDEQVFRSSIYWTTMMENSYCYILSRLGKAIFTLYYISIIGVSFH